MRRPYIAVLIAAPILASCAGTLDTGLDEAKHNQKPIFLTKLNAGQPTKKGHITVSAQFFNTSGNTYKYVDFYVRAINRFGDPVTQGNDTTSLTRLRFTGPLHPRRSPGTTRWPRTWYHVQIACLALERIEIAHLNGTQRSLSGPELVSVLSAQVQNNCARVRTTRVAQDPPPSQAK